MAASRHDHARPELARGRDSNGSSPLQDSPRLPKGACHFKEVLLGETGPRCGCRRFWVNKAVQGDGYSDNAAQVDSNHRSWCMCGHHACYHDPEAPSSGTPARNSPLSDTLARTTPMTAAVGSLLLEVLQCPSCRGRKNRLGMRGESVDRRTSVSPVARQDLGLAGCTHAFRPFDLDATATHAPISRGSRLATPTHPAIPSGYIMDGGHVTTTSPGTAVTPRAHDYVATPRAGSLGEPENPNTEAGARGLGLSLSDHRHRTAANGSPAGRRSTSSRRDSPSATHAMRLESRTADAPKRLSQAATTHADTRYQRDSPIGRPDSREQRVQTRENGRAMSDQGLDKPNTNSGRQPRAHDAQVVPEPVTPRLAGPPEVGAGSRVSMRELSAIIHELERAADAPALRNGSAPAAITSQPRTSANRGESDHGETVESEVHPGSTVPFSELRYNLHSDERAAVVQSLRRLLPELDVLANQTAAYPDVVKALEIQARRLETLENASVSHSPFEDVSDKIDLMDGRVTEVEVRVEDLEMWRAACDEEGQSINGRPSHRARRVAESDHAQAANSFVSNASACTNASVVSHSTALVAAAHEFAELNSRMASFETRLSSVEVVAAPSVDRPWSLEVVILPWGPDLHGIWAPTDSPADAPSGPAEWTQSREVGTSRTNSFNQDGEDGAVWNGRSITRWAEDSDYWKSARACSNRSRVYKRLKSRGLVRDVQITGGSAKDVENAILKSCGGVLQALAGGSSAWVPDSSESQASGHTLSHATALGLRSPFIPLRKVHRDSCLRFLTPAEMATSTLWTAEFLASSVVMKAGGGQRTLFVTHRDGYLQESRRDGSEWTWPKLRELPKVDRRRASADARVRSVLEGDAREACWEWDPRLDAPASTHSSFAQDQPHHSAGEGNNRHQRSQHHTQERPARSPSHRLQSTSPGRAAPVLPASPLSNRPPEPKRRRDASGVGARPSIPTTDVALTSQSKRAEACREPSLSAKPTPKRRRISRSPTFESSAPGGGVLNWAATPRRSAPPSPFFSEVVVAAEVRSQVTTAASNAKGGGGGGGNTQFAYATPHSGPVVVEGRDRVGNKPGVPSSMTGPDLGSTGPDLGGSHFNDHMEDEAWEGVGDDHERSEEAEQDQLRRGVEHGPVDVDVDDDDDEEEEEEGGEEQGDDGVSSDSRDVDDEDIQDEDAAEEEEQDIEDDDDIPDI